MRVCIFIMLLPVHVAGGMENNAWDLARGIAARGHDVTVITSRHPKAVAAEESDGVHIHYCDVKPTSKMPLGRAAIATFKRLHEEAPFDIVHSQSFAAHWLVADSIAEELKVPIVTTMHGTKNTEIKSNVNQGLSLMLLPKIAFHTYNHHMRTKDLIRASKRVIAISDELFEGIPEEFGIPPERVARVYNGIDTRRFSPGESGLSGSYEGRSIILAVSVLHKQKGVQHLIRAFEIVKRGKGNAILIIAGDGPYRGALESLAQGIGVGQDVEFIGLVENARLPDYYRIANAFVIPTVRVEGLPLIELEAMSSGCPVIASDIGGIPSAIEDGVDGILVPPGDEGGLAKELERVLNDADFAHSIGDAARNRIAERFSLERMVEDTVAVYDAAIKA